MCVCCSPTTCGLTFNIYFKDACTNLYLCIYLYTYISAEPEPYWKMSIEGLSPPVD